MGDGFRIDARDLEHLSRGLRQSALGFREAIQPEVTAIGLEIAAAAKALAAEHSQSIPPTITVLPVPGAVAVRAGSEQKPIAALEELGNKGSPRSAPTFKHPVFGNRDVWVEQPKHPYLRPALAASRREITRRMEQAWGLALHKAGLRME